MSTNRILAFGAGVLLLYLAFVGALWLVFPRTEVGYDTALTGRVTGTFQRKSQRTFFLNDQRAPRYDFDAFAPVRPAGPGRAGPASPDDHLLSRYLRSGDVIRKPGRAAVLTVQRGNRLTRWECARPMPSQ